MIDLQEYIKARQWTLVEAARQLGMTQPRLDHLCQDP
ncbi:hypothetical protein [Methylomagnum sp.]